MFPAFTEFPKANSLRTCERLEQYRILWFSKVFNPSLGALWGPPWTFGSFPGIPHISLIENEGLRLRVEYLKRNDLALTYTVEFSDDLSTWIAASGTPVVTDEGEDWDRVVVEDSVTTDAVNHRFARVQVSYNP